MKSRIVTFIEKRFIKHFLTLDNHTNNHFLMPNYYQNDQVLNIPGYEVYFTRFADSIIKDHFVKATTELTDVLTQFTINESQIIEGGGGLSTITQKLGSLLVFKEWRKANIESEHHIAGRVHTSESHEIDHYKLFDQGNIGLEIEWNNKDPFFDRDLENFRKLHQIGELSIGIIITRGISLQHELYFVIHRFLESIYPFTIQELNAKIKLSDNAKSTISKLIPLSKEVSLPKIATAIFSSKYGTATTHMDKLLLRLNRGVGNPCPFILIGIGKERLTV